MTFCLDLFTDSEGTQKRKNCTSFSPWEAYNLPSSPLSSNPQIPSLLIYPIPPPCIHLCFHSPPSPVRLHHPVPLLSFISLFSLLHLQTPLHCQHLHFLQKPHELGDRSNYVNEFMEADIFGIKALMIPHQLRWSGHSLLMPDA